MELYLLSVFTVVAIGLIYDFFLRFSQKEPTKIDWNNVFSILATY